MEIKLGKNEYETVEYLTVAQFGLATKLLSKLDLKPIFLLIAVTFDDDGVKDDLTVAKKILENGFFTQAITDLFAKNGDENVLCDIASLVIQPKGKPYDFDDIEAYNEARQEYVKDLMKSNFTIMIELLGFFLNSNILKSLMPKSFSVEEELPSP